MFILLNRFSLSSSTQPTPVNTVHSLAATPLFHLPPVTTKVVPSIRFEYQVVLVPCLDE